jgi:hypothetical protein
VLCSGRGALIRSPDRPTQEPRGGAALLRRLDNEEVPRSCVSVDTVNDWRMARAWLLRGAHREARSPLTFTATWPHRGKPEIPIVRRDRERPAGVPLADCACATAGSGDGAETPPASARLRPAPVRTRSAARTGSGGPESPP